MIILLKSVARDKTFVVLFCFFVFDKSPVNIRKFCWQVTNQILPNKFKRVCCRNLGLLVQNKTQDIVKPLTIVASQNFAVAVKGGKPTQNKT